MNIEISTYAGNESYRLFLELEVDTTNADAEYNSLDTGVGISTVMISQAGIIVEDILSAKVIGGLRKDGSIRKFDLPLSKNWISKNYGWLLNVAEKEIN